MFGNLHETQRAEADGIIIIVQGTGIWIEYNWNPLFHPIDAELFHWITGIWTCWGHSGETRWNQLDRCVGKLVCSNTRGASPRTDSTKTSTGSYTTYSAPLSSSGLEGSVYLKTHIDKSVCSYCLSVCLFLSFSSNRWNTTSKHFQ